MKVSNKNTLEFLWEEVSRQLGYPNLKTPRIVFDENFLTASINMETKDIKISSDFLKKLNIPIEIAYKGISAHEANHYVTCPFNLENMLLIQNEVRKIDSENKEDITNYFEDVIVNLDLVNRNMLDIVKVYNSMDTEHIVDETLKGFYYSKTKLDFGARKKDKISIQSIKQLHKINFENTDLASIKKNAYQFAKIISPLLRHDKKIDKELNRQSKYCLFDNISIDSFSKRDAYNASKDLTKKLSPQEYELIINDLKKSFNGSNFLNCDNSILNYYELLSEEYPLKIKNKSSVSSIDFLPYSIKEWEAGDSLNNVDYFKSRGKIFPAITKERTFKTVVGETKKIYNKDIPDALIIIDSSVSMTNPQTNISYAVLGGFCAANHYLNHEKRVGVINFSSQSIITNFSSNKKLIHKSILNYQEKSTNINLDIIKDMIYKKPKLDLYLITDMELTNTYEVLTFFEKESKLRRTNIFLINYKTLSYRGNLNIYSIQKEEDIPKIIIDDLNMG